MLRALLEDSPLELQAVLERDPDAVSDAFFDCSFEPVLCYAVRNGASESTLELLLRHGADILATDMRGNTAATLLCEGGGVGAFAGGPEVEAETIRIAWTLRVAKLFLNAGVKPHVPDCHGRLLADVARENGNVRLAAFWEFFRERQAAWLLQQAMKIQQVQLPLRDLTPELLHVVLSFMLPEPML